MIIGFDAKRAFQNNNAMGNYSRMVICNMARYHQDVHAFCYAPSFSGYYQSYFSSIANVSTHQPSGFDRHLPHLWRSFGVSVHMKGDKVQLYHGLSYELPRAIPQNVKTVVTMHDCREFRSPKTINPLELRSHIAGQRYSCRKADVVLAISEATKREVVEYLKVPAERIRVVYPTCDQIFWKEIPETDKSDSRDIYHLPEKYIVCVGSIEERKNQLTVIRALQQLPKEIHLVIVGRQRSSYYNLMHKEINALGLVHRVHVIDNADFIDFPSLYANSLASVYMSEYEGFGVPVLESMCCDTPVVTTNVSSMPEIGGDAALYVAPTDVDALAKELNRLIVDENLRADMIAKGRKQREKFAPKVVTDQLYQIYSELLSVEDDEGALA